MYKAVEYLYDDNGKLIDTSVVCEGLSLTKTNDNIRAFLQWYLDHSDYTTVKELVVGWCRIIITKENN